MNKERGIGQNITFISGDMELDGIDSVTQNMCCTCKHYRHVAECALKKSSLLCFDFCVKLRLGYSIKLLMMM